MGGGQNLGIFPLGVWTVFSQKKGHFFKGAKLVCGHIGLGAIFFLGN